jgi:hypothetical protein
MKAHRDPRLAAHLQTRETFNYSRGTKRERKTARLGSTQPARKPSTASFCPIWEPPAARRNGIFPQTLVRVVSVSGRCGPYKRSGELNAALRKSSFRFSQVASRASQTGSPRENRIYLRITNNVRDLAWKKRSDHPADARHSLSRNSVRPYLNIDAQERSASDNRWRQTITQRRKSSLASSSV